jgi:hypothetical protein
MSVVSVPLGAAAAVSTCHVGFTQLRPVEKFMLRRVYTVTDWHLIVSTFRTGPLTFQDESLHTNS